MPGYIQATGSLHSVIFDGTAVTVLNRRGDKVLRQIPFEQILAVSLKPSRPTGGSIRFRVSVAAASADVTYFGRSDGPAFEALAGAVQAALDARPAYVPVTDPWAPAPAPVDRVRVAHQRRLARLFGIDVALSGCLMVLLAVPILAAIVIGVLILLH